MARIPEAPLTRHGYYELRPLDVLGRTDLELYGAPIAVEFVDRIRGQVRFDGIDALIVQMNDDVRRSHGILGA